MPKKNVEVAICYDFDGTLSPGNMQEYDFFNALGGSAKNFWAESREIAKDNNADPILAYMMLMIDRAATGKAKTTRQAFQDLKSNLNNKPLGRARGKLEEHAKEHMEMVAQQAERIKKLFNAETVKYAS